MSTVYTGVAGNVSLASSVTETIPADGVDPLNVVSVNTPLQKIADYLEAIRAGTKGTLIFGGVAGTAAATNYFAYVGGFQTATFQSASAGHQQYRFTTAIRIINLHVAWNTTGQTGGTTAFFLFVNGASTGTGVSVPASDSARPAGLDASNNVTVSALQTIALLQTNSALTASPLNVHIQVDYVLA